MPGSTGHLHRCQKTVHIFGLYAREVEDAVAERVHRLRFLFLRMTVGKGGEKGGEKGQKQE